MIYFLFFVLSNNNGTDDMKAGGKLKSFIMTVRAEGQARVPNGVKDIVSKISVIHIYIYIGLIILFNYAKQGMPFFPFIVSLGFP